MSSSFIITNSSLKKNGRNIMSDFLRHIHDDYFLSFDEFKAQREFYDKNILSEYKKLSPKNYKCIDSDMLNSYIDTNIFDSDLELNDEELLKVIEDNIKNNSIDVNLVFNFFDKMDKELKLDSQCESEIDEDLYYAKKAFIKAYDLFHFSGHNLED